MGEFRFAKQVPRTVAHSVLKDFVEHFVDKEKLRKYGLMWNSFAQKPQCIPMDRIQDIPMPSDDRVFFYDERGKSLYATKMADVITYILELEPWDQVDACVFNREMGWVLAITHEDMLLFLKETER